MSVCLHGNRADNPGANYKDTDLSFSWWEWRPLATYCFVVARDLCERSHHVARWQSNDGRMTADEADHLAFVLQREIDSGRTKRFAQRYIRDLENLPDVPCIPCNGTGKRSAMSAFGLSHKPPEMPKMLECNACDGYGARRPDACMYSFSVAAVQKLATFLKHSGGFEVQ